MKSTCALSEPALASGLPSAALPPAHILIADDHPLICAALSHGLREAMPGARIRTVSSLAGLEGELRDTLDLDLILLDLHMPGANGFSSLLLLRAQQPALPVIVISANDHPRTVCRARQFGAAGFLSKSAPLEDLLAAISTVLGGGDCFPVQQVRQSAEDERLAGHLARLTPTQMRVLMCIADGMLNKQIAHELGIAENTVKVHVGAVLSKLECHSRTHAAVLIRSLDADGMSYDRQAEPIPVS